MRRSRFLGSNPFVSAVPAAALQEPGLQTPSRDTPGALPDARPSPRFFSPSEFAALRRLSDLILPQIGETPGALACNAPEFLDFLIAESPLQRRDLYRSGLEALNTHSIDKFDKEFAALDATQADAVLAPLHEPWASDPPKELLATFLRAAKADIYTATVNSREWIEAASPQDHSATGIETYWLPVD